MTSARHGQATGAEVDAATGGNALATWLDATAAVGALRVGGTDASCIHADNKIHTTNARIKIRSFRETPANRSSLADHVAAGRPQKSPTFSKPDVLVQLPDFTDHISYALGSPTGDGYGGVKGMAGLPCETPPLRYDPNAVGVAIAGRDTGSSQFFVTHGSIPHLDGEYTQLGTASGHWDALIDGDHIISARVVSDQSDLSGDILLNEGLDSGSDPMDDWVCPKY